MHLHNKKGQLRYEICKRLKFARVQAGFETAKIFAEKKDLKISTYTLHEAGTRSLSFEIIELYSYLLNVNPDWLLSGVEPRSGSHIRNVPIINWTEIGAYPNIAKLKDRKCVASDIDLTPCSFGLIVNDDSMKPRFAEGTILIVDCNLRPKNKDLCLILNYEKKTYCFKQFVQVEEKLYAKSVNAAYKTFVITKCYEIIGKVVQASFAC